MMMKFTSLVAMTLVTAFAGTAFAQQKVADPQLKEQAQSVMSKWETGINNGDIKEIMDIQTPTGVEINAFGVFKAGSPERAERAQKSKSAGIDLKAQVTDVQPLGGDAALAIGTFEVSFKEPPAQAKGNFLGVIEKQGTEWKLPALSLTPQPPPKK